MAINRFMQPAQGVAPYVATSTFVPKEFVPTLPALPLKEFGEFVASRQKEFDDAIALAKKTKELIKPFGAQTITGAYGRTLQLNDRKIVTAVNEGYKTQLDDVLSKLRDGDLSIRNEVENLARDYANNQTLIGFKQNEENIEEQRKEVLKHQVDDNDQYVFNNLRMMNEEYSLTPFNEDGSVKVYTPVPISKPIDKQKALESGFKGLVATTQPLGFVYETDAKGKTIIDANGEPVKKMYKGTNEPMRTYENYEMTNTGLGQIVQKRTRTGISEQSVDDIMYTMGQSGEYASYLNAKTDEILMGIKYSDNPDMIDPKYIDEEKGTIDWKSMRNDIKKELFNQDVTTEETARVGYKDELKTVDKLSKLDQEKARIANANLNLRAQSVGIAAEKLRMDKEKAFNDFKVNYAGISVQEVNPTSLNPYIKNGKLDASAGWFAAVRNGNVNPATILTKVDRAALGKTVPQEAIKELSKLGITKEEFALAVAQDMLTNEKAFNAQTSLEGEYTAVGKLFEGKTIPTTMQVGTSVYKGNAVEAGKALAAQWGQTMKPTILSQVGKVTPEAIGRDLVINIPEKGMDANPAMQRIQSVAVATLDVKGKTGNGYYAYDLLTSEERGDYRDAAVKATGKDEDDVTDADMFQAKIAEYNASDKSKHKARQIGKDVNGRPFWVVEYTVTGGKGKDNSNLPALHKTIKVAENNSGELKDYEGNQQIKMLYAQSNTNYRNAISKAREADVSLEDPEIVAIGQQMALLKKHTIMIDNEASYKYIESMSYDARPVMFERRVGDELHLGFINKHSNGTYSRITTDVQDEKGNRLQLNPEVEEHNRKFATSKAGDLELYQILGDDNIRLSAEPQMKLSSGGSFKISSSAEDDRRREQQLEVSRMTIEEEGRKREAAETNRKATLIKLHKGEFIKLNTGDYLIKDRNNVGKFLLLDKDKKYKETWTDQQMQDFLQQF